MNVASQADAFYDGKTPGRTPNLMYTLTPAYDFPGQRGQFYVRYEYIGRIFADNGDQVVRPPMACCRWAPCTTSRQTPP